MRKYILGQSSGLVPVTSADIILSYLNPPSDLALTTSPTITTTGMAKPVIQPGFNLNTILSSQYLGISGKTWGFILGGFLLIMLLKKRR